MQDTRRTDLAVEAKELAEGSVKKTTALPGVKARDEQAGGYPMTRVEILDGRGEKALGKPVGTYLTLTLPGAVRDRAELLQGAQAVAEALSSLKTLPEAGPVLVAGLGNRQITPDALGPDAMDWVFVTRHLVQGMPKQFADFRSVAAVKAGVTGTTGLESGELIEAVVRKLKPACLIAVDALAARRRERLCRTVQVSDTGIVPGSGVGNHRMALNQETLGIPVIAVGIPTVVEAATLCADLLEEAGRGDFPLPTGKGEPLFVTSRNVDREVASLAKLLGFAISSAVQGDFSVEEVETWTS